jgi:putative SOS response-associated peptidase YedK
LRSSCRARRVFANRAPYSDYLAAFSELRIPVCFPRAAPNLEPRDDIWPTDTAPVIRQTDNGAEFTQLRWGFPPARPKGAPIIALTLLTTEPGPDVAPLHNRQVVVLPREDWRAWLLLERPEAALLRPLPSGSLAVEQVR